MRAAAHAVLPTRQTVGTLARTEASTGVCFFLGLFVFVFFLFFFCIITNCFRLRSGGGSTLQRGAVISTGRLVKGGALPRMLGLS